MRPLAVLVGLLVLLSACGSTDSTTNTVQPTVSEPATESTESPEPPTAAPAPTPAPSAEPIDELFPDVLDATATQTADGSWSFDVTVSSPYDSPQRYADAWRVLDPDGNELGVRELAHDHAGEQPFTRSLGGVDIPEDVTVVTIEGRDQESGWGGATVRVTLS